MAAKTARKSGSKNSVHTVTTNIAEEITNTILAKLAEGTVPWHKAWDANRVGGALPRSLATGKVYRGINIFWLSLVTQAEGYTTNWWGTYNQFQARGGQVRKGEKGTMVVFWKFLKITDEETGDEKVVPILKTFKVFNVDQVDRIDPEVPVKLPKAATAAPVERPEFEVIEECEQVMKAYYAAPDAPSLRYGGDEAYFSPSRDHVQMPERESFDGPAEFYGTWFHETVHSTGHASRLARPDLLEAHRFGDASYTREELTAEMGAAMLSAFTGVGAATIDNSAAYLASRSAKLKDDPKALVVAAGRAHKAVELILGAEEGDDTEEG